MASTGMAGSTMQGGKMGYQVGGVYGAVIGAAIGAVLGYNKEKQAKKQVEKYNDAILANATSEIFNLQRQMNVVDQQTSQALAAYQDQSKVTTATYNASYGAADMIGSSGAAALNQVMDYQTSQAEAQVWHNFEVSVDNHNTQVNNVYTRASNQFVNDIPDDGSSQQAGQGIGSMLGGIGKIGSMFKKSGSKVTATSSTSGYNYGSLSNIYSGSGSMGSTSYSYGSLSNVYSTG